MKQLKLSLALLVFALGFAQESFAGKKEEYQKQSATLVYSIENIQNELIPKDLKRLDIEAGGYLSVNLAAEIAERLDASIELIRTVRNDPSLSLKEKEDIYENLSSSLGELFMTSVVQIGDDKLNPQLEGSGFGEYAKKAMKELRSTFTDLVQFPKTAEGTRTSKVKERMLREYISQDAVIKFQKLMHELGQNSEESVFKMMMYTLYVPAPEKKNLNDNGTAELALMIRSNRLSSYYTVWGTLGFGALLWTLFPVDWPGMVVGYDLATPRIADFITYSSFVLLGLIRKATGAFGTIPGLKRLIKIMENPEAAPEFSNLKLPLFAKIMRIEKKVTEARRSFRGNRCDLF